MKEPIHIIYVPGLNDHYDGMRRQLLRWWRYRNVTTELVPMNWSSDESYAEKFGRLNQAIDRAMGKRIVLIGESAGGSMAVTMYARRSQDLHRVMTICGKNTHPETVSPRLFAQNPALKASIYGSDQAASQLSEGQCQEFVSFHPLYDNVVPIRETLLPGCRQVRLWAVGHLNVIVMALTVSSYKFIREARRAKQVV